MRPRLQPRRGGSGAAPASRRTAARHALKLAHGLGLLAILLIATELASAGPRPRIIAGKVSTFTPADAPNITADGQHTAADPGIALWGHSDTLGRAYCVTLHRGRLHAVLRHIDVGPAPSTGRKIDITGAGVGKLRGEGDFATDLPGKARLLPRRRGPAWRCGDR